jgi:transcriptional regulator with XRE-family HTH domain
MTNSGLTPKLAAIVRDRMTSQGKSVNGLAEVTGIPFSTLNRRVRGQRAFTTNELELVAVELGTSIVELFAQASTTPDLPHVLAS